MSILICLIMAFIASVIAALVAGAIFGSAQDASDPHAMGGEDKADLE